MSSSPDKETTSVVTASAARTDVAIAIVTRRGKVLICQRPAGGAFAGFWEFPGGKRDPGESVHDCLVREVREELAMDIQVVSALRPVDHEYPRGRIRLHPFVCAPSASAEPQLIACQAAKWVDPNDLRAHQFPPANESLIAEVIDWHAAAHST